MNFLKNIWRNFKAQPDVWFFYGFLLSLTLSIRKVIKFYPIAGEFNEYAGIYLYLSDIFLVLTLCVFCVMVIYRLYNTNAGLSSLSTNLALIKPFFKILLIFNLWVFASIPWSSNQPVAIFRAIKVLEFSFLFLYVTLRMFHPSTNVPRGTISETCHPELVSGSNLDSDSQAGMTNTAPRLPRETKLFHVEQLDSVWGGTLLQSIFQIIILSGLFQAIIGIWQFFAQHSLGLFWLKESLITPNIDGVAKIILDGEKYIRAYGLFPHPNILGGFLLFSIILSWAYQKLFHPSANVPRLPRREELFHVEQCATTICHPELVSGSNLDSDSQAGMTTNVPRLSADEAGGRFYLAFFKFLPIFKIVQILALLLTFSKSAILGLLIALAYIYYKNVPRLPRETKLFHVEQFSFDRGGILSKIFQEHTRKIVLIFAILALLIIIFKPDINSLFFKTFNERLVQLNAMPIASCFTPAPDLSNVPRGTFERFTGWSNCQSIFFGYGAGQLVLNLQNYPETFTEPWQYQPVHNVFLLIWSELGIVGLILFIWFVIKIATIDKCRQMCYYINYPKHTFLPYIKGILWAFLFISLFDHYLWDIQQGQILLWLVFGLLAGLSAKPTTCYDLERSLDKKN